MVSILFANIFISWMIFYSNRNKFPFYFKRTLNFIHQFCWILKPNFAKTSKFLPKHCRISTILPCRMLLVWWVTRIFSLLLTETQETPLTTTGLIPSIDQSKLVTARLLFPRQSHVLPTPAHKLQGTPNLRSAGWTHHVPTVRERGGKANLLQIIILVFAGPLFSTVQSIDPRPDLWDPN